MRSLECTNRTLVRHQIGWRASIRMHSIRDAIARGVAYVSEDRLSLGLIQPQSISDNTVISVLDRILGDLGLISPSSQSDLVRHWISQLAVKSRKA